MDHINDWKTDPLVQVQDAILPVMWFGGRRILNHQMGRHPPEEWQQTFQDATMMLSKTGVDLMTNYGVTVTDEDKAVFDFAADKVIACQHALEDALTRDPDPDITFEVLHIVQDEMHPAVREAIDRYRMVFINLVIATQRAHAEQTSRAVAGLDKISKQIFFISINASVEAARVGDAGRGFLQISTDIRALSQSAQEATRDLSDVVADNRLPN